MPIVLLLLVVVVVVAASGSATAAPSLLAELDAAQARASVKPAVSVNLPGVKVPEPVKVTSGIDDAREGFKTVCQGVLIPGAVCNELAGAIQVGQIGDDSLRSRLVSHCDDFEVFERAIIAARKKTDGWPELITTAAETARGSTECARLKRQWLEAEGFDTSGYQ